MSIYKVRYRREHPKATASGDVYEHVLIAEAALGNYLPPNAQIHHVDGNHRNNAPSNLVICQDVAYHKLLHVRERILRAGGNPNTDKICSTCQTAKPLAAFALNAAHKSTGRQNACRDCASSKRSVA